MSAVVLLHNANLPSVALAAMLVEVTSGVGSALPVPPTVPTESRKYCPGAMVLPAGIDTTLQVPVPVDELYWTDQLATLTVLDPRL